MPRLVIRCGGCPPISRPSKRIDPLVGARVPDSMLKMVLLPEPLGPMRPRISLGSTANDTLLTAVNPPKRLVRLATVSMPRWRGPSLGGVGRRRGQRQGRLPMLQALGPHDVGLVVD